MGVLRVIALSVLSLSFVVFVALFGRLPALRNTPIGFLHRLLLVHVPKACRQADYVVTGGRATQHLTVVADYLVHENHPVVLIFWLGILTVAAVTFLSATWTRLCPQQKYFMIPPLLAAPYIFTYLCCTSTASVITADSVAEDVDQYPYDHTIFHPNSTCRTCNLTKPARSKHCPLCRTCVARHDHHCVWVMNCLGRDNYRYFLGLLLSLVLLLSYGAYLGYILLHPTTSRPRHHGAIAQMFRPHSHHAHNFVPRMQTKRGSWATAIRADVRTGSVGLLALLTAPLAAGLLAYHLYLLWAGTTTNETSKWSDLRDDMADGCVWRGRRLLTRQQRDDAQRQWPVLSDQIIVRTSANHKTDEGNQDSPKSEEEEQPRFKYAADGVTPVEDWQRCWRLADVTNLYDLGFWDTLCDVLLPTRRQVET